MRDNSVPEQHTTHLQRVDWRERERSKQPEHLRAEWDPVRKLFRQPHQYVNCQGQSQSSRLMNSDHFNSYASINHQYYSGCTLGLFCKCVSWQELLVSIIVAYPKQPITSFPATSTPHDPSPALLPSSLEQSYQFRKQCFLQVPPPFTPIIIIVKRINNGTFRQLTTLHSPARQVRQVSQLLQYRHGGRLP